MPGFMISLAVGYIDSLIAETRKCSPPLGFVPSAKVSSIDIPCVFLYGTQDTLTPANAVKTIFSNWLCSKKNIVAFEGSLDSTRNSMILAEATSFLLSCLPSKITSPQLSQRSGRKASSISLAKLKSTNFYFTQDSQPIHTKQSIFIVDQIPVQDGKENKSIQSTKHLFMGSPVLPKTPRPLSQMSIHLGTTHTHK